MIEPKHPKLSVVRQCELLGLARASYYHQPEPEPDENLHLMRVIDETYLAHPEFGSRPSRTRQVLRACCPKGRSTQLKGRD